MRICGIAFEPTNAVIAIIECSPPYATTVVDSEIKRIPLDDHQDSDCLRSFTRTIEALIRDYAIDSIAVRKCTYSGKYQSGTPAIKMEALLQILDARIELLSPQTIASRCKSSAFTIPDGLNKYQHDAFKTAYAHAVEQMDE